MKPNKSHDRKLREADDLARKLHPLLRGVEPEVAGVALAECVARLFAGTHPDIRNETFHRFIGIVYDLMPVIEEGIKRDCGSANPWELN